MKSTVVSLLSLAFIAPTLPAPTGISVFGVFVATSPCDAVSRSLLKIPETTSCELIKWRLTLYQEPRTLAPATYRLSYVYGLPQQGTNGISQGGTKVEREGKWAIVRGRNTEALIYQLNPDRPQESLSFQMINKNLLHLLQRDESLMIGNAGWSYTLSGEGDFGRHTRQARPQSISRPKPGSRTASASSVIADSAIVETFVGRSPCREVARELNKAVDADCMKLKWDLTLNHDPVTRIPTTYRLKGTLYRERIGEGRWAIVKGTKTNPEAVVYQLDPDKAAGSLFFLKADNSILFFLDKERNLLKGNGDFSYTLNRTNDALKN